jgi:ribosomal protein S12 methylthiotransferase accessory factor
MIRRFEETGDRVVLLDLTSDNGIPCILSVLMSDRQERPARVFAASADLKPERALTKALEELAHTRRYSQQIRTYLPPVSADDNWSAITTQVDHLSFAADHANVAELDQLLASSDRVPFGDLQDGSATPADDLIEVAGRVSRTGHRVLAAKLTSPDVETLGLHVWRALIPGYHPLFMGHRIRALGGRRLYEVPQRLGHSGLIPHNDRNVPHPYP